MKKSHKLLHNNKTSFITIHISNSDKSKALKCAEHCLEFDYPKDRYEIIIDDDSNDKAVSKQINTFAQQHELVKVTRRGNSIGYKAGNLNHMLKRSKGDIIVLFDSDFIPPKDFLKKIVKSKFKENKLKKAEG